MIERIFNFTRKRTDKIDQNFQLCINQDIEKIIKTNFYQRVISLREVTNR